MKEKLTLQDLIDLLAKKAGLTKKEADAFFREFFSVITDNIFNNEQVKIKDFGTFKLTKVNSRESIDVNTGEKIEIPAHYKLSFIPDKALKVLVNKPFEQFETTLLEDTVSFDSIEESEEPVVSSEEEDTAIDEPDLSPPIENVAAKKVEIEVKRQMEEITSRIEKLDVPSKEKAREADEPEAKEKEKPLPQTPDEASIVKPSFVYTYITNEEVDDDDTVITVVVPGSSAETDELSSSPAPGGKAAPLSAKEIEKEMMEAGLPEYEDEGREEVPLNINKVQEKIDQLKEAIDALGKVTWQNEPSEDSLSTKPAADEADIYNDELYKEEKPVLTLSELEDVELSHQDNIKVASSINQEETNKRDAPAGTEIPADAYGDITAEINRGKTDKDLLSVLMNADDDAEKPVSAVAPEKKVASVDEDGLDDDPDYYGYTRDTFWTKFRKRLPIILFLLVVIALGAYHFAKLFEQKVDYQNYNPYRNLSGVDTIPNVVPAEEHGLEEEPEGVLSSDISAVDVENSGLSETLSITDETNQTGDITQQARGKRISENLNIGIVRKAAYIKQSMSSNREEPVQDVPLTIIAQTTETNVSRPETREVSKFPLNEVVRPGSSLRSISKRNYGDNTFWVYIYEENKSKIRNFDALSVGQVLVIPDLKKYNTGVNDPRAVEKAKDLERKIFSSSRR